MPITHHVANVIPSRPAGPWALIRFLQALLRWARNWFATVPRKTYLARSVECSLCVLPALPETDPATAPLRPGWNPHSGRCNVCGCYALKLHLATETCPLRRWPAAV